MKRLLLIATILLLVGCSAQKDMTIKSKESVYREQVLQGQISMQDYFYLLDMEKELNEMKTLRNNRFTHSFQEADSASNCYFMKCVPK